jgi:hypothetical protein
MTEYTDVPEVNTLSIELDKVDKALTMINDTTGTLRAFTIGPMPPDPEAPVTVGTPIPLSVQVFLPDPAQQATVDQIEVQLNTYRTSLVSQLTALGVTNSPPAPVK